MRYNTSGWHKRYCVYWRLDYQAIYETATQKLDDFDEFARQVKRYLASEDASV